MIQLKSLAAGLVLAALSLAPGFAQGVAQLAPGQVWGNSSAQPGRGAPASVSQMIDQSVGSTRGSVLYRGASGWVLRLPGTAGLPLVSAGTGADPTYAQVGANALPAPTASTLGGVQSLTCSSHNWFSGLSTGGVFACSQPSFADLTSSLACSQTPALTGDVTTSAGACATTIAAGAVSNSKLAASASAWSLKGNPTAAGAAQQDFTVSSLASKASPAGSDLVMIIDQAASGAMKQTTVGALASAGSVGSVNALTGAVVVGLSAPGGRLAASTGTNGVCSPTTDLTAQTTVQYQPCNNPYVPIYNGTNIQAYNFTSSVTDTVGLALNLGSNWAASTLFDVFVTLSGGVPVLCSVPWTSSGAGSSSRATALALYGGFQTNGAAIGACRTTNAATIAVAQNQGTYVGTFLTNGSAGQVDLKFGTAAAGGGAAVASIWNAYNQILGSFVVADSNTSWTPTASTYQPLDAAGAGSGLNNRVTFTQGLQANAIDASLAAGLFSAASNNSQIGIGLNSTTGFWSRCFSGMGGPAGTTQVFMTPTVQCAGYGAIGLNYLQAMQYSTSASTSFFGAPGGTYSQVEGLVVKWLW